MRKVAIHVTAAFCLSVLFTLGWHVFLNYSSGRIIHSWEQPKEINYWRNANYTLYVIETAPDWFIFGGRTPRQYIFICWSDSYGDRFDCSFQAASHDDSEIDAYIQRSIVEWTVDGVSLKQESGHVIFFPAKTFIGGR